MTIISYQQAVKHLESFIGKIIFKVDKDYLKYHDPLERMRILLSLLGNPQGKFKSVLVGGTSGKGSTAYLISHILTTAGYKTGVTISPHLQKINERVQINGEQISDEKFTGLATSMIRIIEAMEKMPIGAPSYFEILIAMAFKYFADKKVDVAVVEVGMGGEFDGTNTLNPLIAVLTNVGLDHTNVLGKTVEKIAITKAGIIKGDKRQATSDKLIVVSGVKQPSVVKIIRERSDKAGAELRLLWRDFGYKIKKESLSGMGFDFISHEETLDDLKLSLLGQYQAENASLAIKTILELKKLACLPAGRGFNITDKAIRKALKTAFFPGRFEIVRGPVTPSSHPTSSVASSLRALDGTPSSRATPRLSIVLDGAHNPTKMKAFLKSLKKLFPTQKKIFIIGFKFDKDMPKMLKEIVKVADKIIVTEFNRATDMNLHASADALNLKSQISNLKSGIKVTIEKDSGKAMDKAINILITQYPNNPSVIVVTGSLYLVGEIRDKL